tara:strand:+ start:877 stop:1413 length:537 start_codon:yes stop_codon:yes gene_type:complete
MRGVFLLIVSIFILFNVYGQYDDSRSQFELSYEDFIQTIEGNKIEKIDIDVLLGDSSLLFNVPIGASFKKESINLDEVSFFVKDGTFNKVVSISDGYIINQPKYSFYRAGDNLEKGGKLLAKALTFGLVGTTLGALILPVSLAGGSAIIGLSGIVSIIMSGTGISKIIKGGKEIQKLD